MQELETVHEDELLGQIIDDNIYRKTHIQHICSEIDRGVMIQNLLYGCPGSK